MSPICAYIIQRISIQRIYNINFYYYQYMQIQGSQYYTKIHNQLMHQKIYLNQNNYKAKIIESKCWQKKPNNILQLKEQLVKMKQFLNQQMPSLSMLIKNKNPHFNDTDASQTYTSQVASSASASMSNQEISKIMNVNQQLMDQNKRLCEQLKKQKSLKKQLNKSLRLQQKMISNLFKSTDRRLPFTQTQIMLRNGQKQREFYSASGKNIISYNHIHNHNNINGRHVSHQNSLSRQKANIFHKRRHSKSNSNKFISQTRLQSKIKRDLDNVEFSQKEKIVMKNKLSCQYSQSDQQTIVALKQINNLENALKQLMRESKMTQSRSKKLQIRNRMQKIANKIHNLKNNLNS